MKIALGSLYFVFPAVLLFAQMPHPTRPEALPKSFPPEMIASPPTTPMKVSHSNCVHAAPDGKSLSVNRCDSIHPGVQLIAPFTVAVPNKKILLQK
jgi:hypothetical protein